MKGFCASCGGTTKSCPYCGDYTCLCHEGSPDAYNDGSPVCNGLIDKPCAGAVGVKIEALISHGVDPA